MESSETLAMNHSAQKTLMEVVGIDEGGKKDGIRSINLDTL